MVNKQTGRYTPCPFDFQPPVASPRPTA